MHTEICRRFNVEFPILAFSHCRDVVAAVSQAGGMGVYGAQKLTPDELEVELKWLDKHTDGCKYGVDVMIPASLERGDLSELKTQIPAEMTEYVDRLCQEFGIPTDETFEQSAFSGPLATHERARGLLDVAFAHHERIALIASALGPPPSDIRDRAHEYGMQVLGMAGTARHAVKQQEAGTDIVVAVGTEAAGHTGEISTMVLVPDVVDAIAPTPVVAAGGVGSGRQLAAALALGAEGVWCGSVWLTTVESDLDPLARDMILAASGSDTVRSRYTSGKPIRTLRTPWTDAWSRPEAPAPLPLPMQGLAVQNALDAMKRHRRYDLLGSSAGQVIGRLNKVTTSRDVVLSMAMELAETLARLDHVVDD